MPLIIESDVFVRLGELIKSGGIYEKSTGNDEIYKEFISEYPSDILNNLSLEQYCLGKGSKSRNFSWWIERGLEKSLGRYSPGTSRGHLLYLKKDGSYYIHRNLKELGPEKALKYILKTHSVIANAELDKDITWIDDNNALFEKANVEPRQAMGEARKLRILSAYHPDKILPVSSSDHIKHFLLAFGYLSEDIPKYNSPIARMLLLKECYLEAKKQFNSKLTPYGFMKALYSDELGIRPMKDDVEVIDDEPQYSEVIDPEQAVSLNQILFGPPGTGKTFSTTAMAVKIADAEWYAERYDALDWVEFYNVVKERYDELVEQKRIVFTTFHQSFAYEDFIEGIRASTDEQTKALRYEIQDGIFKQICETADVRVTLKSDDEIDLKGRRIWKMSLGNTLGDEDNIYQECLDNNYILLGYGRDIDFSGCNTRNDVKLKIESEIGEKESDNSYRLTSVHTFKNVMEANDIVVVSDGNQKFRTIGVITGDYSYIETDERIGFQQKRQVKWLREYVPSLPIEQLFKKSLSQMTLYELRPKTIDHDKLAGLLAPKSVSDEQSKPHVLIIDEINRGNISRIFGELITLLEESKRKGGDDARWVTLPYSKRPFSVPDNLYVIGTMNTADKSLAQLDLALRRRFTFVETPPKPALLSGVEIYNVNLEEVLNIINQRIEVLLDKDHLIGHSYFLPLIKEEMSIEEREDELARLFELNIIPLLKEYFFDDWERIGWVLNDPQKKSNDRFIQKGGDIAINSLFGNSVIEQLTDRRYQINRNAFSNPTSYQGIIKVKE